MIIYQCDDPAMVSHKINDTDPKRASILIRVRRGLSVRGFLSNTSEEKSPHSQHTKSLWKRLASATIDLADFLACPLERPQRLRLLPSPTAFYLEPWESAYPAVEVRNSP